MRPAPVAGISINRPRMPVVASRMTSRWTWRSLGMESGDRVPKHRDRRYSRSRATRSSSDWRLRMTRASVAVDQDLGGHRAGVVVGGHGESVGAGAHQGDDIALLEVGDLAVLAEEVAGLADRADDIHGPAGGVGRFAERDDVVVALVEGGADQVVHAGIDDLEGLGGALLLVEAGREQDAGVADDVAAGFEEDLEAGFPQGRNDRGRRSPRW